MTDANEFMPVAGVSRADDPADDGIQPGAVTASCEDSDSHGTDGTVCPSDECVPGGMLQHMSPIGTGTVPPGARAGGVILASVEGRLCVAAVQPRRHGEQAWCLPKGKLDAGESALGAALREVREETGLLCEMVAPIGTLDYQVADAHGVLTTKHTAFWLMTPIGGALAPSDGEIRAAAWRPLAGPDPALTHPDEQRFVEATVARIRAETGESDPGLG
jgi:8-oxo-dGTP pyrophosphatase MutT (NUDIX family)